MKTRISPILAIVLSAVALVFWLPLQSHAASAAGTLGELSAQGTLYGGGSIFYRLSLTANTAGTLTVEAKIKGKGWKADFPVLTTEIDSGESTVDSEAIPIPLGFLGDAKLQVKATLSGGKLGKGKITVTIGTPPPSASVVQTNLYDVGFNNNISLDGTFVPTSGLSAPLTYTWQQTGGAVTATLSATNVLSPNFTTAPLTNFVLLGTSAFFTDVDEDGNTNQVYVTREDRFASNNVNSIALNAENIADSTYVFQLVVSDGSIMRTGVFTVACANQTPAQPSIPLGVKAFYRGATNSTDWSLISKPADSLATLNHTNGLIPELRPDVEGVYVIQDNVTGKTVTNTAASWAGVQFCAVCHGPGNNVGQEDKFSLWNQTGHSTMAQRGVDGVLSSHYSEACFQCHTVGYNKTPTAVNGGFDDIAKDLGWVFPTILQPGNYAAMPSDVQAKANIQCESCHGPGSRHPGYPSVTTDVRVCAQCHQDGNHHVRPEQWEISPHSGGYENISNSRGTNPQCARCHSPRGYIDVAKGLVDFSKGTNDVTTGVGALTCQSCHNPHDKYGNDDRHQVRVWDEALFGNPYLRSNNVYVALGDSLTTADLRLTNSNLIVTNAGASAACMVCHNGRQLPTQVIVFGTSNLGKQFYQVGGPHDSLAGEAFTGVGAYDYGKEMGNSFHTYLADCQSCHMHQLAAGDTILVNDVATLVTANNLATYANVVGNHTFKMNYVNGGNEVDNIAACNQCHASFETVESFDFKVSTGQDYDGNGLKEGVQTEVKGLLSSLAGVIVWGSNVTPPNGTVFTNSVIYASTNATGQIWMPLKTQRTIVSGVTNYITTVDTVGGSWITGFGSAADYYGLGDTNNLAVVEAQRKAVWNWLVAYREGSFGVHNSQFSIRLLQTSYTDVSTNSTGNATNTFHNLNPSAFLR